MRKHERRGIYKGLGFSEWWADCFCGWSSPTLGSRARAIVAHRLHVRDQQRKAIGYRKGVK